MSLGRRPLSASNLSLPSPILSLSPAGAREALLVSYALTELRLLSARRGAVQTVWKLDFHRAGRCRGGRFLPLPASVLTGEAVYALGVLGEDGGGPSARIHALARSTGSRLWSWAPQQECVLTLTAAGEALYLIAVREPVEAGRVGGPTSVASLWSLDRTSGSVAWRTPLCSSASCVPHALLPLGEEGAATLASNATHLLLQRVDRLGQSLWERPLPGQLNHFASTALEPHPTAGPTTSGERLLYIPSRRRTDGSPDSGGFLVVLTVTDAHTMANRTLHLIDTTAGVLTSSFPVGDLVGGGGGCLDPLFNAAQALVALVCAAAPTGATLVQFAIVEGSLVPVGTPEGPVATLGPPSAELVRQHPVVDASGTVLILMRANKTAQSAPTPVADSVGDLAPGTAGSAHGRQQDALSMFGTRAAPLASASSPEPASNGAVLCSLRFPALDMSNVGSGPLVPSESAPEQVFAPLLLPSSLLPAHNDSEASAALALAADGLVVVGGGSLLIGVAESDACTKAKCHPIHGRCVIGDDGRAQCFCEANYVGNPSGWDPYFCSQPYAPGSYSVPLWISFGVAIAVLAFIAAMVCFVYRSLLWLRFRVKLAPVYDSLLYRNNLARYDAALVRPLENERRMAWADGGAVASATGIARTIVTEEAGNQGGAGMGGSWADISVSGWSSCPGAGGHVRGSPGGAGVLDTPSASSTTTCVRHEG